MDFEDDLLEDQKQLTHFCRQGDPTVVIALNFFFCAVAPNFDIKGVSHREFSFSLKSFLMRNAAAAAPYLFNIQELPSVPLLTFLSQPRRDSRYCSLRKELPPLCVPPCVATLSTKLST